MKVIHYVGSVDQNSGGVAVFMQVLGAELNNLLQLMVVTGKSENPLDFTGINLTLLDLDLIRWFHIQKEFRQILESEKPDLVHINGIWKPQNYLFQKVAKSLGIKVVISPHGMLEPYILQRNSYKKKLALFLYQKKAIVGADFLLTTANSESENIKKLGFTGPSGVIPNGLDFQGIRKKKSNENNSSMLNILFLSRIHPKKGIELLIESVGQLKNQDVKLIIAGEGEQTYINKLIDLTYSKGLEKQIHFLGGIYGEAKWKLYQQANLFVLPTYSENFGIVVIEALAAGVPVITTKGTPWEELEIYKCGWWIDLNVANLTHALTEAICKSKEELKEMGLRGRKLVEEKYDNKIVAKKICHLYNDILQN